MKKEIVYRKQQLTMYKSNSGLGSYSNNFKNIRPVKKFSKLQNNLNKNWSLDNALRNRHQSEVSEFERLLH
jgi:hypothetical protein